MKWSSLVTVLHLKPIINVISYISHVSRDLTNSYVMRPIHSIEYNVSNNNYVDNTSLYEQAHYNLQYIIHLLFIVYCL